MTDREKRKTDKQAEEILAEAASHKDEYAAEMDKLLEGDESYEAAVKKYGKRRYVSPKKRITRVAAALLIVGIVASVTVPVEKASAWRIWWLDLITGENQEDVDLKPEADYSFMEYYIGKLPEGYEIVNEEWIPNVRYKATLSNSDGNTIYFYETPIDMNQVHLDNEDTEITKEVIGDFEVLVDRTADIVAFEINTDKVKISIDTDGPYESGAELITGLEAY